MRTVMAIALAVSLFAAVGCSCGTKACKAPKCNTCGTVVAAPAAPCNVCPK